MIDVSFDIFDAKFDEGLRQRQFERLCLHVFCYCCGIKTGVFQYDNHAGIETIDVNCAGKWTGFQAKYFTKDLPGHKKDFIESIATTRKHNTRVEKVYFFLPVNPPGVSSATDEAQKPTWMRETESYAAQKGIEIDWFGLSRFQSVFANEEMQYLARHYFCQNPDLWDFIASLRRISQSRLSMIRNEILFQGKRIHLEHSEEIERIEKADARTVTIVSGIGGVGKSAIVKDWFGSCTSDKVCALMMQPNEVVEQLGDAVLSKTWRATFNDFLAMTAGEHERRILVVDAAEKLADGKDLSELLVVLHGLLKGGWKVMLTTRSVFEKKIVSHFRTFLPDIKLDVLDVIPIGKDVLTDLSVKYGFELPANEQVGDAIRTSFNLAAYLSCEGLRAAESLKAFQDAVWLHFVMGDNPADTAGQTLCEYVEEKLRKDISGLLVSAPTADTGMLIRRGVMVQRRGSSGYLIAHDVYEEWAAVRVMNGKLQDLGLAEFEKYVASSHGLRRGLQFLVEQKLAEMNEIGSTFLWSLLVSKRDSTRIDFVLALLRSKHMGRFLKIHSRKLVERKSHAFENIVKGVYNFERGLAGDPLLSGRQVPQGSSWLEIIDFACANQEALQDVETPTLLLLMQDWALAHPENNTVTVSCAQFAWKAVELGEPTQAYSYRWKERLAELILSTSGCEKKFEEGIRNHLSTPPNARTRVLNEVCRLLMCEALSAFSIVAIRNYPQLVRDIAWKYWRPDRDPHERYHELEKSKYEYGLPEYGFDYFPPSSLQGPTYVLLRNDPAATIGFIIDFVNACVADAVRVNPKRFDTIALTLPDGERVKQWISLGLWDCYRDKGIGEHVPYLLKAMHMALERYLLEMTESREHDEICGHILWALLRRSKSASLTAVVVSIVTAHPMEFAKFGLVLIAERKIFICDARRHFAELQPDITRALFPFPKREHDLVRDEADKRSVRKQSLENVIWQYQIVGSKDIPDLKQRVEKLIDGYSEDWSEKSQAEKFWLTRIDVRRQKLKVSVDKKTNQALISSELILSEDMQARKEKNEAASGDQLRMMRLTTWGTERIQGKLPSKNSAYSDIKKVLQDVQWLLDRPAPALDELDVFEMTARRAAAAALIMFYQDELTLHLKHECERVLLSSLDLIFDDHYRRVKWDRVDIAVFAIPYLLPLLGWWQRMSVRKRFVLSLLDENGDDFLGTDRICDFGMAGVRAYCDRVGDKRFGELIQKAYRRHFLRYQAFVRYVMTPGGGSILWKMRIALCRMMRKMHVRVPASLSVEQWMAPRPKLKCRNLRRAYDRSFMVRFGLFSKTVGDDVAHLACNVIGFHFPTKLNRREEIMIVSNVKLVLEYLFREERGSNIARGHLYLSQLGRSYMKHLGCCVLNMSEDAREDFLAELEKVPQALRKPELLDACLRAQYNQRRADNFWKIWNGMLAIVAAGLKSSAYCSSENCQVLDVMALRPLYWEGDGLVWDGTDTELSAYFDSLVDQCGCYRSLIVSIMKFVLGAGRRFLLASLKWIDRAMVLSKDAFDYQDENAKQVKECFEQFAPLIAERIDEIKTDPEARKHCVSILDNLVAWNSLPAFRLREAIMR